jgi:CheY-like chemotaxis protein
MVDYYFSHKDPFRLTEQIKETAAPQVRVLAFAIPGMCSEFYRFGADACLVKPFFSLQELVERISAACSGRL